MLMEMMASMAGISPDKLAKEIEGFATLATESRASLDRIETNTQENGVMLRAICAHLKIEVPPNVRSNPYPGTGNGPD